MSQKATARVYGFCVAIPGLLLSGLVLVASAETPSAASYETRNIGWVCSGAGGLSTGGIPAVITYAHRGVCGQPGGVTVSSGSGATNLAGFLHAVDLKQPATDTDGDGLADELDGDNDNDMLGDRLELGGQSFSPSTATDVNRADTDGDGMADGGELSAGTDPTDATSLFRITALRRTADDRLALQWTARADTVKRYRVLAADARGYDVPATPLATNQFAGGAGPWFQTMVAFTNSGPASNRFFTVQALP